MHRCAPRYTHVGAGRFDGPAEKFGTGLIRPRRPSVLEEGAGFGRWGRRRETIEEQMARAQQNKKPSTVRTTSSSRAVRTRSKPAVVALGASALAIAWAGIELTGAGGVVYAYGFFFTEFFAGVVALVSLSLTVMLGLLATDRLVLLIRHRVLLQSAHRATGILGVAGLVVHVITKISIGRAGPTDAIVPFIGGSGLYVGLGTVAAFLMVSVLWTGLIRVRFAGVGPKWFWRALHSLAYVSWPFALLHGLNAGRAAKTWVVLSYLACVLLVVVALLVRVSVHLGRRSREQHQAAALNKAMTGRSQRTGVLAGLTRRRAAGKEESRPAQGREGGWAETTTWTAPAGTARRRDPERFAVPVVPEPGSLREPVWAAATRRRREEELARVGDRRDDAPASVGRRRDERPARRYRDAEERITRRSRSDEDDVARHSAPPDTGTRYSAPPDPGRRYSAPPRRLDEPEEPWDSPRRWATRPVSGEPVSAAPRSGGGRHSVEADVPEEPDYWRPPARYAAEEAFVDDTPTLVDLASRRALRASGEGRSSRRRRANADAVDGAYWAGLRGEAK
ncbi:ferric reductase-like transmembrane domain-containing protein [Micromonospora soli]|uniref:ferric reductase-like transmembrane domain-containing protein n=1 Tax=Micromonospora sp. NBRC 110009 TaxID=3061627 RepID=UPI002671EFD6|nr:ferric reductase-like transmembrane domain-containing protein [Micromonospora sp. NBRC 110009]WKT96253.1 ferric reductase-like transmembrane domain-containing protein [Micromonospora sp. NBRC 110009]